MLPLWRALFISQSKTSHYFLLVFHHIIADEWSLDVFWRELIACYEAYQKNEDVKLSDLSVQYDDYALWQQEQIEEGVYEKQLGFWQEQLADAPLVLQLPTDYPRPATQKFEGALLQQNIDSELTAALQSLARDIKTTLFTTLLAAYQVLLHRFTSQDDILVGIPIANRGQEQTENLIGFFLNTLVMRADFTSEMTFTEHLTQIAQKSLEALNYQDVPFDLVVDALKPKRDPSYNPIFQTMFVYQDGTEYDKRMGDVGLEPLQLDLGVSKFDVTLFARLRDDVLEIGLEYDTALFSDATMQRFMDYFVLVLETVIKQPTQPIHQLELLTETDKEKLTSWNDTFTGKTHEQLIQE